MATSILMALGSCRRMISARVGRAWCSQVAREPCEHRPGWRELPLLQQCPQAQRGSARTEGAWRGPEGKGSPWGTGVGGEGGGVGAYNLSAEVLDDFGVGQDLPGQLLLLLRGLEDHAPLAEPHDVLLHQVQVDKLHELLRGQGQRQGREPAPHGAHTLP